MARRKKLTRDELLARKRAAEQARRDKIKLNPEAHAQYKEKEKHRYQKRKEDKKQVQISDMSPRQKRNQRKKWKINSKNYRDRQRHKVQLQQRLAESTPPDTDSDDAQTVDILGKQPEPLNASPGVSQRRPLTRSVGAVISAELVTPEASRQCDSLTSDVLSVVKRRLRYNTSKKLLWYKKQLCELRKQNEMLRKRIFRNKHAKKKHSESPKTKIESLLLDPKKKEDVKKALVFAETIKNNLTINYKKLKTNKQKQEFKENIEPACKTLKKYKILRTLEHKMVRKVVQKKSSKTKNIIEEIRAFFECDDNSRMAAGKKECITRNQEKKQKRFLLDSLINLHKKFLETHNFAVSYSFFCKNKPFWVVAPLEKDKETCMCKLHENVTLLAQALWKNKIIREKSSTEVLSITVCSIHNLTCLEKKCPVCINKVPTVMEFDNSTQIRYWIWESGPKEINNKKETKVIKITEKKQHSGSPKAVLERLMNNLEKFYVHCANITNQYKCMAALKNQLNFNEVVIHMDFSENYSTKYNTEIQSLHFGGSRSQISLHTSVIYVPGLEPQSFCTYSDCLRHDAFAVWGHIIPILKFLETMSVPDIDTLHIITDSTCSQYRNKTINYIITKLHWHFMNLKCVTWNYTEAGHGKGAPDGVGATLKRTADQIVRYGKDIPDVNTFATEMRRAVKNILLEYVSEYDIYEKEYFMPPTQALKPFKGMMQVHQIVWNKNNENTIVLRRQSCVSELCKTKAAICVHGKHMGFYDLPMLSSPSAKKKPIIISNILITPKSLPLEKRPDVSKSHMSSNVVPLHRCQNFIATGNFDLPFELRDIDTNHSSNSILESVVNAESPSTMQSINNPSDGSDVDTSHITPDFNFFAEPAAEDARTLTDTMQDLLPAASETTEACSYFDVELVHGDTHFVSEDSKSPSILITDIEVSQDLPPPIQEDTFKIGSWVIISYRIKKTTKYFIGQIMNTYEDNLIVKFLRRVKAMANVFTWPENDDEDCVSKNSIAKVLHEPIINRRGQLMFNDTQDFVLE